MIILITSLIITACVTTYVAYKCIQRDEGIEQKMVAIPSVEEEKIVVTYKGENYDVTKFAKKHPGGKQILIDNIGKDIESAMSNVGHSSQAYTLLNKYKMQ